MEYLELDPRKFISEPYIECPYCGSMTFGVLDIGDYGYHRRCRQCLHPTGDEDSAFYRLPPITKKIIYLDQFVISNIMKALNPAMNSNMEGKIDDYWYQLFLKLDRLCRLQLISCPQSVFHENESIITEHYQSYKKMYQHLSAGIHFKHCESIRISQLCKHAKAWVMGDSVRGMVPDMNDAIYGSANRWMSRIFISSNTRQTTALVDDIRKTRVAIYESISDVFSCWQGEKGRRYDDWFGEECQGLGAGLMQAYYAYYSNLGGNPLALFPSPAVQRVMAIRDVFIRHGVSDDDVVPRIASYLASTDIEYVPFTRIASSLYAAIAQKAANGMKRLPNMGMANDVNMISTLLPYCDAMFVDNECRGYLDDGNVRRKLKYGTQIFSYNNRAEFIRYLDDAESEMPKDHLEKVLEVYGESWLQPNTSLFRG